MHNLTRTSEQSRETSTHAAMNADAHAWCSCIIMARRHHVTEYEHNCEYEEAFRGKMLCLVVSWRILTPVLLQVGAKKAAEWLQSRLAPRSFIRLACKDNASQDTQHLRRLLAMLRSVDFKQGQGGTMRLVLSGWSMTESTLAALRGLPQWACNLHFATEDGSECTWSLPPHAYEQLGACVPTSYTVWRAKAPMGSQLLKSICAGGAG